VGDFGTLNLWGGRWGAHPPLETLARFDRKERDKFRHTESVIRAVSRDASSAGGVRWHTIESATRTLASDSDCMLILMMVAREHH
jgi:hypothetical protein